MPRWLRTPPDCFPLFPNPFRPLLLAEPCPKSRAVTITAGKLTSFSEVKAGSSYLSQSDLRVHFGLGAEKMMEQ